MASLLPELRLDLSRKIEDPAPAVRLLGSDRRSAGNRFWRRRTSHRRGAPPSAHRLSRLRAFRQRNRQDARRNCREWRCQYPHPPRRRTRTHRRFAGGLDRTRGLLYPDPWPKRRQRKRRFLSEETLQALARILRDRAELRFATDIDDYSGWTLARVARSRVFAWTAEMAKDWVQPWDGWSSTRYEARAIREGRPAAYLTFVRMARRDSLAEIDSVSLR